LGQACVSELEWSGCCDVVDEGMGANHANLGIPSCRDGIAEGARPRCQRRMAGHITSSRIQPPIAKEREATAIEDET
jgi:hypothetical protein